MSRCSPMTRTGKREIPENSDADTPVGARFVVMDDDDDVLTYSLGGRDAASFTIDQDDPVTDQDDQDEGGQINVKDGTKLDREMKDTYMVRVIATDPGGLEASMDVTITVTDVNEAPEIMVGGLAIRGQRNVERAERSGTEVATYTVVGPDAASARWSLIGRRCRGLHHPRRRTRLQKCTGLREADGHGRRRRLRSYDYRRRWHEHGYPGRNRHRHQRG